MSLSEANKILHGGGHNTTATAAVDKPFRGATLEAVRLAVSFRYTQFQDQYNRTFTITYLENGLDVYIRPLRGFAPCGRFSLERIRTETEGI